MSIEEATAADFQRALLRLRDDEDSAINFTSAHAMLRAQCRQTDAVTTSAALAESQQWKSASTAATQYAKLGKQLASYLELATPKKSPNNKKPMWWTTLSTGVNGAEDHWAMRPALKEALETLKWDR